MTKEERKEYMKHYSQKNKEKFKEYNTNFKINNSEKINQYNKKYWRKKYGEFVPKTKEHRQEYMRDYMKDYQKNNTELMKNQRLNRNTLKDYEIDDYTKIMFRDNIHSIVKIYNLMKSLDEETIKKFIHRREQIQIFPAKESNPMIL